MMLALYRGLTTVSVPIIEAVLKRRLARGKELPDRLGERRGIASTARPDGTVIWVHAASVGESMSVLPLLEMLLSHNPGWHAVMTSGTVTSAKLLATRLPARATHQFAPLDRTGWVDRFLDHWTPGLALFVESDIWPNMITRASERGIKTALVNGRLSDKSFRQWSFLNAVSSKVFGAFDLTLATDSLQRDRLAALGSKASENLGSLKWAAPALTVDQNDLSALARAAEGKAIWLAASTHSGEEEAAFEVHLQARKTHKNLLTIIAPRHPQRGTEIAELAETAGLRVGLRSRGDGLGDVDIFIADSMGEMGLWFSLASVVFVAGSFVPVGGHNPLEPAHFDNAVLFGPLMPKNQDIADRLLAETAAIQVADADALASEVSALLSEGEKRGQLAANAAAVVSANQGLLEDAALRIENLISGAGHESA